MAASLTQAMASLSMRPCRILQVGTATKPRMLRSHGITVIIMSWPPCPSGQTASHWIPAGAFSGTAQLTGSMRRHPSSRMSDAVL